MEAKIEKFDPRELRLQFQDLVFPEGVFVDGNKKLRTTKLGYIYELKQKAETKKSRLSVFVVIIPKKNVLSFFRKNRSGTN